MTKPKTERTLPTQCVCIVAAFVLWTIASIGLTTPANASALDGIIEYVYSFFDNEENQIRRGLEDHLRTGPGECLVYGPLRRSFGYFMPREKVEVLEKSGIATFSEERMGILPSSQVGNLTEFGQRYYFPDVQQPTWQRMRGAICVGRRELASIDEYTAPSQIRGKTVTQVRYQYRLVDIPEWATTLEVINAFPEAGRRLAAHDRSIVLPQSSTAQDTSDTVVLVKTNVGWRAATPED
ncbi:hypothetical protein [Parvibaculum sp.]|uniref:hypothetical protein n=1 Tax=Parvibaculum sp. TaxID=2024848 RepID=UPI001D7075DD|nr:hypothetical protein [Parvibaculum sp.]MBX3489267.1 hypothetical protein [Parvibaculum sp.]MCW5726872.1 hypothetical protein [Parvibaculum sp.]